MNEPVGNTRSDDALCLDVRDLRVHYDGIKAVFPSAEKVESMIFSNAIGYYRYGLLRLANGDA